MMIVREIEFKGKPVLEIKSSAEDKFPLALGVMKAKKVLESVEELKAFVAKYPYTPRQKA